MDELLPRLAALARLAKDAAIGFTIDAEEADRLDLSLDVFDAVAGDPSLAGWDGLGLAIQAYQKRCFTLVDWLQDLARRRRPRPVVRLADGALSGLELQAHP